MSRVLSPILAFVLLGSQLPAVLAQSSPTSPMPVTKSELTDKELAPAPADYATDRVIVKWREAGKGVDLERARGLNRIAELGGPGRAALVAIEGRAVEEVISELRADPAVEYAEPDYVVSVATDEATMAAVSVNDPGAVNQYALNHMRVRDAWSLTKGGNRLIAVLDTGVSTVHADLSGRVVAGYNFVGSNSDARDDHGHGTWVAGIIAANTNNGTGMAGISWTDKILPVKVLNSSGNGHASHLTAGIIYAADRGASVINLSLGGYGVSQAMKDAVDYAWSKGVVLVGAAGNNRREEAFYPAAYPNVISVSATQRDDEFSNWSSYGSAVDVSAPGSSIYTTDCNGCSTTSAGGTGYTYISGTSFATPNTAGVIALIQARYPTWTNQQVVNRLYATVDDLGYPGKDKFYGRGRVNAFRAVGGTPPKVIHSAGDAAEPNNSLAGARSIALGGTTRPSIYPAGDVDFFYVDAPRAGRVDVAVTAIKHELASPWHKSSLPVDPILEIYDAAGTRLVRVDNPSDPWATERASIQMSGAGRLRIKVSNWFPNGSQSAYSVTTAFVDNVAPTVTGRSPGPAATGQPGTVAPRITFSDAVTGVSASSFRIRDASGTYLPATVAYNASRREATLTPTWGLHGDRTYTLSLTSAVKDVAGNSLAPSSWTLGTGKSVLRITGADRYVGAAALSASTFSPGVPVAVLASGQTFPDALAGAPLAVLHGGPVLLVTANTIPAATANELARLKPKALFILGGTASVSNAVASAAAKYTTGSVTRIGGADRYVGAANISQRFSANRPVVYIASGQTFPDALAGAAIAGRDKTPVLLVQRNAIPAATAEALKRLKPGRIAVFGGPATVSDGVLSALRAYTPGSVSRLAAGADRYSAAAAASAASFAANRPVVYVVTGANFPDGLAAAAVAGPGGAPVLLVPPSHLPSAVANELKRLNPSTVIAVGGPKSINESVLNAIRSLWP